MPETLLLITSVATSLIFLLFSFVLYGFYRLYGYTRTFAYFTSLLNGAIWSSLIFHFISPVFLSTSLPLHIFFFSLTILSILGFYIFYFIGMNSGASRTLDHLWNRIRNALPLLFLTAIGSALIEYIIVTSLTFRFLQGIILFGLIAVITFLMSQLKRRESMKYITIPERMKKWGFRIISFFYTLGTLFFLLSRMTSIPEIYGFIQASFAIPGVLLLGMSIVYAEFEKEFFERQSLLVKIETQAQAVVAKDLPDINLFKEHLDEHILLSTHQHTSIAVFYIDLPELNKLYDIYGYAFVDKLLSLVIKRLRSGLYSSFIMGRDGAQEFILAQYGLRGSTDIEKASQSLLDLFRKPFHIYKSELYITPVIGIALFPEHGRTAERLIQCARTACSEAVIKPGGSVQIYSPRMTIKVLHSVELASELRKAVEKKEFILYYQPIVDLHAGQLEGFEVLLRWNHPRRGLLTPQAFLHTLDSIGLFDWLYEWILETSLTQLKEWEKETGHRLFCAVNLPPKLFQSMYLADHIQIVLYRVGIDPDRLELELTEHAMLDQPEISHLVMENLQTLGIRLALDDFGTGYSSFLYLQQFPFQVVKIDRIFIQSITSDGMSRDIIEALVKIAHKRHLTVCGEGIETYEQLALLKKLKCDRAQGFLFQKPQPADGIHLHELLNHIEMISKKRKHRNISRG